MEYIAIPGLDQQVSRLGIGTWAVGGWMWGGTDEQAAVRAIRAGLDQGVNLIDTAPVYGFGRSEEIVGRAVAEHGGRERLVLATKTALNWTEDGQPYRDGRPERIRSEVEDSLRRLGTDYLDLYQVHWPDPETPIEETAETLAALREEGKVRALGVSNHSPEQMDRFRAVAPLHTVQPPYNLFEREAEHAVLPYVRENGLGTLTYGALCRGLLTGKMREDARFEGDDLRQVDPKFQAPRFAQYLAAVEKLDAFAREHYGRTVLELAVRWVLDQPGVSTALWGLRRPDQAEPMAGVFGWHLEADALQAIDDLLAEAIIDPVGPEFMAPPTRSEAGV
jgi:aryl-alcohol dehydrogenase-like predicted oxidoreductase